MEMKPKVLIVWNSNNRVEHRDCDGVQKALEDHGCIVEQVRLTHMFKKYDKIDVNSFDVILFKPWFNAMFASGGNTWELHNRLHNEFTGKVFIFYCDIKMKFTPYVLKNTENVYIKKHFFDGLNSEMIYSLSHSIIDDEKALYMIKEKIKEFNMPITFIEWNFLTMSLFDEIHSKYYNKDVLPLHDKIYWGQSKRHVIESLKEMNYGNDGNNDIGIGPVTKSFKKLCFAISYGNKTVPFEKYVPMAKNILVPYEYIKGDYQFTLRYVEMLALKHKDSKIVFHENVSDYLKQFSNKERVLKKYEEVCNEFIHEIV